MRRREVIGWSLVAASAAGALGYAGTESAPTQPAPYTAPAPAPATGGPLTSFRVDTVRTEGFWGKGTDVTSYLINTGGPVQEFSFGSNAPYEVIAHGGKLPVACVVDDAKGSEVIPATAGDGQIDVLTPDPLNPEGYVETAGIAESQANQAAAGVLALCIY